MIGFCVRCKAETEWSPPAPKLPTDKQWLWRGWKCIECGLARKVPGEEI